MRHRKVLFIVNGQYQAIHGGQVQVLSRAAFGPEARLFIFIGILGGFTTFSSFAYETFSLARDTQNLAAIINVFAQVTLGLIGVWFGHVLARLM